MVGCDTNSNQHSRSCSCSCTSIIYSELLSDNDTVVAASLPKTGCSGALNGAHSPKCSCPPPARPKPPVAVISDEEMRPRPLSTTTCLPLPLPPTPIASRKARNNYYYREPDYLRLERTLISTFDGKPFMPKEPQRVVYARSSPKCVGELFCAQFDHVLHLKKNRVHRAEYVIPTDPQNTPFHSVVYLKGERKVENIPMLKEVAQTVKLNVNDEGPPVPHYAIPVTPQGTSLLEPTSSGWNTVLRALASSGSSRSSVSDQADEMAKLWKDVFGKEVEAPKNGPSVGQDRGSTTRSRSFTSTCSSEKMVKPWKRSHSRETSAHETANNDVTSWEEPLTERGAFRSGSSTESLVNVHRSKSASSHFTEWDEEIQRLRDFLETEKSASNIGCFTAKTISSLSVGGPVTSSTAPHGFDNSSTVTSKFAKMASNGGKAIASWAKKAILKKN